MFFYIHTHIRAANVVLACTLFHSSAPRYKYIGYTSSGIIKMYENVLTLLNRIRLATFPLHPSLFK